MNRTGGVRCRVQPVDQPRGREEKDKSAPGSVSNDRLIAVAFEPLVLIPQEFFTLLLLSPSLLKLIQNQLTKILFGFAKIEHLLHIDDIQQAAGIVLFQIEFFLLKLKPEINQCLLLLGVRVSRVNLPLHVPEFFAHALPLLRELTIDGPELLGLLGGEAKTVGDERNARSFHFFPHLGVYGGSDIVGILGHRNRTGGYGNNQGQKQAGYFHGRSKIVFGKFIRYILVVIQHDFLHGIILNGIGFFIVDGDTVQEFVGIQVIFFQISNQVIVIDRGQ